MSTADQSPPGAGPASPGDTNAPDDGDLFEGSPPAAPTPSAGPLASAPPPPPPPSSQAEGSDSAAEAEPTEPETRLPFAPTSPADAVSASVSAPSASATSASATPASATSASGADSGATDSADEIPTDSVSPDRLDVPVLQSPTPEPVAVSEPPTSADGPVIPDPVVPARTIPDPVTPDAVVPNAATPDPVATVADSAIPDSAVPESASGRDLVDSLVDEVGGELDDLEREYRTARTAIAGADLDRRAQVERLLSSGSDRNELVLEVVSLRNDQARLSDELGARDEHVKSLRQQLSDLEDRLERNNVSAVRVNELENEGRRLQRETEKTAALLDAREVERDEISAKLRAVEVEKVQLRRETEALQTDNSSIDGERADMRKQVQKLEAELVRNRRDHEARRVQLEASAEERNEMSQKLSALQEDRAADLGRINELEALIERRDNEIAHLKKSAARNEAEIDRIGDAATELELRSAERDKLRRRVESLESELTAQTTEAGASKKALELLASRTTERDELEKRVIELERDLVKFTALASTGQDTVSQLASRTNERDELEQKVVALEAELARERMQTAEWRETADLVATTTAERDKLRRRVSILEADLESATAELPTRSAELETLERAQNERAQLANRVETAAASLRTGDDELMRRIAALEQQIAEQGAKSLPDGLERTEAGNTAASAAFDAAMRSAAEMRASLEKAAGLLDPDAPVSLPKVPDDLPPALSGAFRSETGSLPVLPPLSSETKDTPLTREQLEEREPLWALTGSKGDPKSSDAADDVPDLSAFPLNAEASDDEEETDGEEPSEQVYTMYRETLRTLESEEAAPDDAIAGEPLLDGPRSRESAELASVLFSRSGGEAIPGIDLAAAPPPTTPPLSQTAPPPIGAPPASGSPFPPAMPPSGEPLERTRPTSPQQSSGGPGGGDARSGNRSGRQRSRRRRTTASSSSIDAADALMSQGSHLLIDGNGVVAQTRFPHRFLDAIERIASERGMSVELVFDSSKVEANPTLSTRDHVQVRFAQGVDVGDVIARLLDTIPASAPTIVATDDSRLKAEARKLQADVIDMGQITGVASR